MRQISSFDTFLWLPRRNDPDNPHAMEGSMAIDSCSIVVGVVRHEVYKATVLATGTWQLGSLISSCVQFVELIWKGFIINPRTTILYVCLSFVNLSFLFDSFVSSTPH